MLIIHLRKNAFSLRIRRGRSHKLSIRTGRGTFLLMLCKTLPAPFDVLKFDILTRETVFFFIESGRGQGFFKKTFTGSSQFFLPIVIGSVAISLLARVFSLVCITQLNLLIACVLGAGLFFSAMEEISLLHLLS